MSAPLRAGARHAAPPAGVGMGARPATVSTTLPNGLRVVLAEDHTVPIVFLSWTSLAGFDRDPRGLEGIASLTPVLLREGTARRTAGRITEELDDLGAMLSSGSDRDTAFLNVALLSGDLAAGLDLLVDMACGAVFPAPAVARVRRRRLAEIEHRRRDPRAIANDELDRVLFGDDRDGRAPLGTPASVQRTDAAAMAAFHAAHYRAAGSCVAVAGSFDVAAVTDLLGSFQLPEPGPPPTPAPRGAPVDAPGGVRLVDVPHAKQAEIRVGHAAAAHDCGQMVELELLNLILGVGPNSRLARRLRQQLGLSYHIRSRFTAGRVLGAFVVETRVATDAAAAALRGIREEIERLRDERIPADEVEQARRRLFGAELRSMQDLIGAGLRLGPAALRNEPDQMERRAHAIASAEPDGLRELARRALHPERMVALIAGPAAALQPQFPSDGIRAPRAVPLESTS